jgi:plasmid replication initiation protein
MAKFRSKKKNGVKDVVSIRKSNDLVEARYRFDIWETRLFTKLLSMIQMSDKDFYEYKIYIGDIIQDFDLKGDKNAYANFKQGAKKLMQKIITVVTKDEGKWVEFHTPIVVSLKNPLEEEEASYIKIGFHPEMRPFLLELKERYLVYDFDNISNLRSPYYVRIYELLKQYEKIGWRRFEVQELKEILGIAQEYKLYGHFKDKIIDKAQENLRTFTDISFTYEEIKKGRSVQTLLFTILPNKPLKKKKGELIASPTLFDNYELIAENSKNRVGEEEKQSLPLFNKTLEKVKAWGVSEEVLSLLFETQSEDAILTGLAYTENAIKQGKVKDNPAGFFIKAVKERYTDTIFEKQVQKEKREQERQEKEAIKKQLSISLGSLRDEYDLRRNTIIRAITAEDESVTDRAIEALQVELQNYFNLKQLDSTNLTIDHYRQDPVLRIYMIEKIQAQNEAHFESLIPLREEIQKLEIQLKKMR